MQLDNYFGLETKKNLEIQSLRGIAIIAVLFYHLSLLTPYLNKAHLMNSGHLGVEMFFLLSGYLIAKTLHDNHFSPRHFLIRRFFRLDPTLLFVLLFITVTHLVLSRYAPSDDMYKLLFGNFHSLLENCRNVLLGVNSIFHTKHHIYMLGQFWSLAVEFQFYMTIFVVLLILHLICYLRKLDAETDNNFISKFLLVLALTVYLLIIYKRITVAIGIKWDNPVIAYLRDMRFDCIALGFLLYYIPKKNLTFLRYLPVILNKFYMCIPFIAGMFFCNFPTPSPWINILVIPLAQVFFSLTLLLALENKLGITNPVLVHIGDLSYVIYIIHYAILVYVWFIIHWFLPAKYMLKASKYGITQFLISVPLIWLVSFLIHKFIEKPSIKLGRYFLNRLAKAQS